MGNNCKQYALIPRSLLGDFLKFPDDGLAAIELTAPGGLGGLEGYWTLLNGIPSSCNILGPEVNAFSSINTLQKQRDFCSLVAGSMLSRLGWSDMTSLDAVDIFIHARACLQAGKISEQVVYAKENTLTSYVS